jgi:hypothetical protein
LISKFKLFKQQFTNYNYSYTGAFHVEDRRKNIVIQPRFI